MKKITFLAVAALAFSFASCKKDRTCTCTETTTQVATGATTGTTTDTETTITIIKDASKGTARANCLNYKYSDSYEMAGTTYNITQERSNCSLK
jgi:hypothetical protein